MPFHLHIQKPARGLLLHIELDSIPSSEFMQWVHYLVIIKSFIWKGYPIIMPVQKTPFMLFRVNPYTIPYYNTAKLTG